MRFWKIFKIHPRLVLVSFGIFSFSTFGQTIFIGLFNSELLKFTWLDEKSLGLYYSLATLASAVALPWFGSLLDKKPPLVMLRPIALGLALGYALLSFADQVWMLFFAFFAIRFFGQASLSLVPTLIILKRIRKDTGSFLSLAMAGRFLGDALWPPLWGVLLLSITFKHSLLSLSGFILLSLWGLSTLLRPVENAFKVQKPEPQSEGHSPGGLATLKHWFPITLFVAGVWFPFLMTGLFFYQTYFHGYLQMKASQFAFFFPILGISQILGNFVGGLLSDHFSGTKIYAFNFLVLSLGFLWVWLFASQVGLAGYFFFIGWGMACGSLARSTMWKEVLSLKILGKAKGLDSSLMVFSTALAPFLFSQVELGQHFSLILIAGSIISLVIGLLLILFSFRFQTSA